MFLCLVEWNELPLADIFLCSAPDWLRTKDVTCSCQVALHNRNTLQVSFEKSYQSGFLAAASSSIDDSVDVYLSACVFVSAFLKCTFIGSSWNLHQTFILGHVCAIYVLRPRVTGSKVQSFFSIHSTTLCWFDQFTYNPWGEHVSCTIVSSEGQRSRSHGLFEIFVVSV